MEYLAHIFITVRYAAREVLALGASISSRHFLLYLNYGPCWGGCYESGHSVKLLEVKRTLNTKDEPFKAHFFQFIAHIISFFTPPQNSHPN